MGWTSGDFSGHVTANAAIAFAMGGEIAARVLDSAMDGDVVYAALRVGDDEIGALVLVVKQESGRLYAKPIGEEMGPADDRCPLRILDLLTTTDSETARRWRKRCRAYHRRAQETAEGSGWLS